MSKRISELVHQLFQPWIGLPRAVYILFFSRIVTAMGCFVMPLLTLILTRRVGLSPAAAGQVLTIGSVLYLPAAIIGGKLTDHWGRKQVYLTFSFISAGLYAVCGFLPASMTMVWTLLLAQFFLNVMDPAAGAMLADLTTAAQRKNANALSYMGWNVGFALGPMIGGLLFERHLEWVFWGDAITTAIGLLLVLFFIHLPKSRMETEEGRELRPESQVRSELRVKPEQQSEKQIQAEIQMKSELQMKSEKQMKSELQMKSRSKPVDDGLPELTEAERHVQGSTLSVLFARPVLLIFSLLNFGFSFVYSQWGFLLPMQVADDFGMQGASFYGLLASLNGLLVIFMTPIVTRLTFTMPHLGAMVRGGLLYAVSLGSLMFAHGHWSYVAVIALFTLGEVFVTLNAGTFISIQTPASHRGRLSAVTNSITGAGFAFGPLIMGQAAGVLSVRGAWGIVGCIALTGALSMAMLARSLGKKK